jgi:beta-glucosidase
MKKILIVICACLSLLSNAQWTKQQEDKVQDILWQMSIEEKVGQMTQINLDVICEGEIYKLVEPHHIDPAKLKEAIEKYHVGSILNCGGHAYPIEQWHQIIESIYQASVAYAQQHTYRPSYIPVLYGIDAIHGANYIMGGTLFPQQLGQAATFNPALVQEAARITAYETRAAGIPWNFSPVLDVGRVPTWSRFFETYGEDPYLCSVLGKACIKGYQGMFGKDNNGEIDEFHVAACMKHFLGYSGARTGKDRTPAYLSDIQLKEIYRPSFQAAIDQGALTVMINSGEINGIPVHANPKILVDLLRNEMGFQGMAVTDWEDVMKLMNIHHVAANLKDAVEMAVNAGIDMCMVPNDYNFTNLLIELVKEGRVSEARLNESVYRILKLKVQLDLFDNPVPFVKNTYPDKMGGEFQSAAIHTAEESITLLENKKGQVGALPWSLGTHVCVVGNAADQLIYQNGAWSRTWQGTDTTWNDPNRLTTFQAIQKLNSGNTSCTLRQWSKEAAKQASKCAKKSDVILVCLGEKPSTEKPGDIDDLNWDKSERQIMKWALATGKPVVLVLFENRPRLVNDWVDQCAAVIMAYQPGEWGNVALANILFGKTNPSGKLPFTYPRYNQSLLTYDHKHSEELDPNFGTKAYNPQWPFGHGLSYSDLEYQNLKIAQVNDSKDAAVWKVSVEVKNNSSIEAMESVLVYKHDRVASVTPHVRKLIDFNKKVVKANSTEEYEFMIDEDDLKFVGQNGQMILESGVWDIYIGNLSGTIEIK